MLKFIALIVVIQLFYGTGITLLSYALPEDQITLISQYQTVSNVDVTDISSQIQSNIQSQLNIPVVDIGTLVFHSGNLLVDMLINFFTAIPSMLTILISTFFAVFPVEAFLAAQIKLLVWVIASVLYFIAFLNFLMNIRSGRGSVV